MTGYAIVNLKDYIHEFGEKAAKDLLSKFSCPLNKDVEHFLHHTAIEFSKQSIAPTHLVFASFKNEPALTGYFTISANKVLRVPKNELSNAWKRRISKFSIKESFFNGSREEISEYIIPAPLIGQLSKNYANHYNTLISGDVLLKLALDKVQEMQRIGGGKFVYLECEDKEPLIRFYSQNGFVNFGKRILDKDEQERQSGEYLIQMLKYLKDK